MDGGRGNLGFRVRRVFRRLHDEVLGRRDVVGSEKRARRVQQLGQQGNAGRDVPVTELSIKDFVAVKAKLPWEELHVRFGDDKGKELTDRQLMNVLMNY